MLGGPAKQVQVLGQQLAHTQWLCHPQRR
jgi:hypothetical protein